MTANRDGHILTVGNLDAVTEVYGSMFAAKSEATGQAAGLMSAADKAKLDGIGEGAQAHAAPTYGEVTGALGYAPPRQDTTYPAMTASELAEGSSEGARTVSPKVVADYVSGEVDGALGVILNGSY